MGTQLTFNGKPNAAARAEPTHIHDNPDFLGNFKIRPAKKRAGSEVRREDEEA
jgi:hypothetical protein